MADISKIKLPSGNIYNIKDSNAVHSITGTNPITVNDTTISLANSGVTAASKGDTTNQTPTWGGTFKVPSGTVTEKGLLTDFADHTVAIPSAVATASADGLMSAADKTTINSISTTYATKIESSNHVVASKTQLTSQSTGDIWLVLSD